LVVCAIIVIVIITKTADTNSDTDIVPSSHSQKIVPVKNTTENKITISNFNSKIEINSGEIGTLKFMYFDFLKTPFGTLKHNSVVLNPMYFVTYKGPKLTYQIINNIPIINESFENLDVYVDDYLVNTVNSNSMYEIKDIFRDSVIRIYDHDFVLLCSRKAKTTKRIIYKQTGEIVVN